jgi:outer membrane protein
MSNKWIFVKLLISLIPLCAGAEQLQSSDDFVRAGLASNDLLRARELETQSGLAALDAARSAYWPRIQLAARYTRNSGGRVLDFPIGDALNPVYRTLNALSANSTMPSNFPQIENLEIPLLRKRDQDTRLSLTGPLFNRQIDALVRAASADARAAGALRETTARTLVRDIRLAYFGYGSASAATQIFAASERVLAENVRVNNALVSAGSATRDQPLRAQAELLALQDKRQSAENQQRAARRYLNFLINRDLDASMPEVRTEDADKIAKMHAAASDTQVSTRPELKQIAAGVSSAQARAALAKAERMPTLSLGVDAGIQGSDYGFGSGQNFASASIVLNWRLFDHFQSQKAEHAANLKADALNAQAQALRTQLKLAALSAEDDVLSAKARGQTSAARLQAAEESFRITERKRDAGTVSLIQFLDAERALTEAKLAANAAQFDLASKLAEREFALASYPLPVEMIAE